MTAAAATSARPRRRPLRFHDFTDITADIATLQSHGYVRAGNWSLGQICDHLRLAVDSSIHGFGEIRTPPLFRVFGPLFLRITLARKRIPAGAPAPAAYLPSAAGDETAAVERFLQSLAAFANFAGPAMRNPLFGPMTLDQWRRLHLIHAAHHLGFLTPRP